MKPLVYVAGPYTHPDPVENTHKAIAVCDRLVLDDRVTPICPHLSLLWHIVKPHDIDFWYRYDLEVMARCDAVLRLFGASSGADAEVAAAYRHKIPVFRSIDVLYEWAEEFAA